MCVAWIGDKERGLICPHLCTRLEGVLWVVPKLASLWSCSFVNYDCIAASKAGMKKLSVANQSTYSDCEVQ